MERKGTRAGAWAGAWGIVGLAVLIAWQSAAPTHDQRFLLEQSIQHVWHPLESGIASRWLAGALAFVTGNTNVFAYDATAHNALYRAVSVALALSGLVAALLKAKASPLTMALSVAVFVTSGAPWVWVSSELLAAAGIGWLAASHGTWIGGWLLTFAKPDLLIPGLVFGGIVTTRRLLFAVLVALTVASSLLSRESTNRITLSFGQHYAFVTTGDRTAFDDWRPTMTRDFGQDTSAWKAIQSRPDLYARFLVRSLAMSSYNVWISGLWLLAPVVLWACWLTRGDTFTRGAVAFVVLNMAVVTALSFCHVRYLIRFLMLGLILLAQPSAHRAYRMTASASLFALLALQLTRVPQIVLDGVWFYD